MASSRPSQNTLDVTDVAVAWAAFEEINSVDVSIECRLVQRGQTREPRLYGEARERKDGSTEAQPLVLVSASSWVFGHKSLDAAVFHLLYTLDGQLAELEMAKGGKKEA